MRSLKTRLVLALVLTNFLVVAIVAAMTPIMVKHEFIEQAQREHYVRFRDAIDRYIGRHGSWNSDADAQRFVAALRRDSGVRHGPIGFAPPPRAMEGPQASPGQRPFEFVLTDADGRVLLGGKDYVPGQRLSAEALEDADTLELDGEPVALVLESGEIEMSRADRAYLHSLEETLLFSSLWAILLIIPLGIWLGHRHVRSLEQLTRAVDRMAEGDLQQQVRIETRDEVGTLGRAFNAMNARLADTYRNLEASRDRIAEQAEQLRELSIRDELTRLFNRRFFNEEVALLHAKALRYGQPYCICLGDIDHFKQINDRYSHAVGDQVLQEVARILDDGIRESDIVARYGGEEMVLALSNIGHDEALALVERLRTRIESHPWHRIADGLGVTMSFGLCDWADGQGHEQLLVRADELLYRSKHAGRNQVSSARSAVEPG